MITPSYAKTIQGNASGANAVLSTGYGSNFVAFPRSSRRSHTVDKGYRTIDLQEHSFHFERACRDGESREAVQSPYLNGRKNKEYVNPTFHSSLFITENATLRRAKTPDYKDSRSTNPLVHSEAAPSLRVMSSQTPREDVVVSRKIDFAVESARVEHSETEKRAGKKSVSIREPVSEQVERIEEESYGVEKRLKSSQSEKYLEVCGGCHNYQLAYEANEARKQKREANLEAERSILENNSRLLKDDQEKAKKKKEALVSTSKSNYETFSEKKTRAASREATEDDIEIKLNNKNMAAESIRSLKRYQSMLDKMYESSMNRHSERKGDLFKSQNYNKASITKNELAKSQEKQAGSLIKWNINEGEKSLLDNMHERSMKNLETKNSERRLASEYNRQSGSARKFSPAGTTEDPFKADSGDYEKAGNGKSLMDKMYLSSMSYWQKQKDGLKDTSKANRDSSALLKKGNLYDEEEIIAREYSSPGSARKPGTLKGKSLLDIIHHSDQKELDKRKNNNLNCSGFNRTQGYSEEIAQLKAKNLDNYYKSPTRKVNKGDGVDYERWTEEGGVFDMISSSAEKLYQSRRTQNTDLGPAIRQQITEGNQRKVEFQTSEKNFKQTPLLVCSHKTNMACCAICNRQIPANKISKIIADYSKLTKGRGSVPKKC